jgi:hypothetical protein
MFLFVAVFLYLTFHFFWLTKGYTINLENRRSKVEMKAPCGASESDPVSVSFSHIQLYVDNVEELQVYKQLEDRLYSYCTKLSLMKNYPSYEEKVQLWKSLLSPEGVGKTEVSFFPQNRDVVKQLLVGLGFRVSGSYYDNSTRSVLITSRESEGVQILVTAATLGVPSSVCCPLPTGIFDRSKCAHVFVE